MHTLKAVYSPLGRCDIYPRVVFSLKLYLCHIFTVYMPDVVNLVSGPTSVYIPQEHTRAIPNLHLLKRVVIVQILLCSIM